MTELSDKWAKLDTLGSLKALLILVHECNLLTAFTSSIQTIIRETAKKRDQLAPRFGTSVCWTPIAVTITVIVRVTVTVTVTVIVAVSVTETHFP